MNPDRNSDDLTDADISVMQVLVRQHGRVTSRETLTRLAGLGSASLRRVDVCLVALRRVLGADSITTVRQRGWILTERGLKSATEFLAKRLDKKP
jgi:DNA-binding winged helix-turn-helix (wHTH) protein